METYKVTYGGGVVKRTAPELDAPQAGTLPANTVFQAKASRVVVGDATFVEMVTGNWVVIQKGDMKTCEQIVRRYRVVYGGGAVVREEPKIGAKDAGAKQDAGSVFEASNRPLVSEGGNTFVELRSGGWVVQQLGAQLICQDITLGDPAAAAKRGASTGSAVGGRRMADSVLGSGDRPSFPTGQQTVLIAPPEACSDVALVGLRYHPPNPTYQVSKTGHYITYRKGIWNRAAPDSNSSSERSDSSVQGAHNSTVVYSVEGLPLRLTDAAVAKIKHAYTGEPLLVTMKLNQDCCHCEQQCGVHGCCSSYSAYSDDTVQVRGMWFGEKDAIPEATMLSDAGCMCVLPPQVQHALQNLYVRPPTNNPCTEVCSLICKGPPLVNHVAIDAYEVKIESDRSRHARIYSSLTAAEVAAASSTRSSSVAGASVSSADSGTTNPMVMVR